MGYSNFQIMLQFVNDLIEDFDIGSDLVRVGVVKYDHLAYTEFNLNDDFNKASLKSTVSGIVYTSGGTFTDVAIQLMRTSMFTTANGDRSAIPNVAIVITDGQSQVDPSTEASLARAAGITIFCIGVGTGETELNSIATDPDSDHVFTVSSFSGLSSIEGTFQTKACTSTTFTNSSTTANNSTSSDESGSSNTAAIVGGAVAGVAALGIAGAVGGVIYSKMAAGQTAVSSINQATQGPGLQQPKPQLSEPAQPEMSIPGLVDAPAQTQPIDTRWPARLPPLRV